MSVPPQATTKQPEEKPALPKPLDAHWETFKKIYNNMDYGLVSKQREFYFLMLIDSLKIDPAAELSILEIGPGDGLLANLLGKFYSKCKILAIDLAEKNVKAAEDMRQKWQVQNVKFREGNALEVAAGQKFDIVIASQSLLLYSQDLPKDLETVSSMLKPGGEVAFIATDPRSFPELKAACSPIIVQQKGWTPRCSADIFKLIGGRSHTPSELRKEIEDHIRVPRPGAGNAGMASAADAGTTDVDYLLQDFESKAGGETDKARCFDIKVVKTAFISKPQKMIDWFLAFGDPFKIKPGFEPLAKALENRQKFWKDVDKEMEQQWDGKTLRRTATAVAATAAVDKKACDRKCAKLIALVNEVGNYLSDKKTVDKVIELATPGNEELTSVVKRAFSEKPEGIPHTLFSRIRMFDGLNKIEAVNPEQAYPLPLKDGSVDAIIVSRWPSAVEYDLVKECERVLKPGGLLVIVGLLEDTYKTAADVFAHETKRGGEKRYLEKYESIFKIMGITTFEEGVLVSMLEKGGFEVPTTIGIQSLHPIDEEEYYEQCRDFFKIDFWLPDAPADVREKIKNDFHSNLINKLSHMGNEPYPGASLLIAFGVKKEK